MSRQERREVFISYSHRDRDWLEQLQTHLKPLVRQQDFSLWDDTAIHSGEQWRQEIARAIDRACVAILLVSPDFLASDFIAEKELPPILRAAADDGLTIVWIPVRYSLYEETAMADFQAACNPQQPLDSLEKAEQERVLVAISKRIKEAVDSARQQGRTSGPSAAALLRHNLPFESLGDLFQGRAQQMEQLRASFAGESRARAITQRRALYGLGGIGKTRLAVEYAWEYRTEYQAAFFVGAPSPEAMYSNLAALAQADLLNLPEREAPEEEAVVQAVLGWLQQHSGWLLIFDNVDAEAAVGAVGKLLPRLGDGHVLITSRINRWPPALQPHALEVLSPEAARQFLLDRTATARAQTASDGEDAGRLAGELDGLPLALEQAGAYIACTGIALAEYLADWQRERAEVLQWHDAQVMQYPVSVALTWQQTLRQLDIPAQALLRLSAFWGPEAIPVDLLEKGTEAIQAGIDLLGEEMGVACADWRLREALEALQKFSMIERQGPVFSVHRMVQEVLRQHVPKDQRGAWIERALRLVNDYVPASPPPADVRSWPLWTAIRFHAERVIDHADRAGIADPTSRLMNEVGLFLKSKALYSEAEPLMRRALSIDEGAYGSDHPDVARDLNNLAQLLQATNRLGEAEPLMRRALLIDEGSYGSDHPDVARDLNNLAQLLQATNRLGEAEPLMRRALLIDEGSYGSEHPDVAIRLNNLAQLLQATNRLGEAEPLMRRALLIDEGAYGSEHPRVAIRLNNLAQLLQATNRLGEAEPLMRRALLIDEGSYGSEHPDVAIRLNNLAQLLQATNRLGEAEPLMRRALAIFTTSLGADHPNTQIARDNLDRLLKS